VFLRPAVKESVDEVVPRLLHKLRSIEPDPLLVFEVLETVDDLHDLLVIWDFLGEEVGLTGITELHPYIASKATLAERWRLGVTFHDSQITVDLVGGYCSRCDNGSTGGFVGLRVRAGRGWERGLDSGHERLTKSWRLLGGHSVIVRPDRGNSQTRQGIAVSRDGTRYDS
jgi:hypothetical protein